MSKHSAPPQNYSGAPGAAPGPQTVNMGPLGTKTITPQPGPAFYEAAKQQGKDAANAAHPNQSTPYGSSSWTQDPATGAWTQKVGFSGGLGDAYAGLSDQARGMANPFDLSGLPALGDGAGARQKAEDALYGRATARLDPQFKQQESTLRARLANEGLDPQSSAYSKAMSDFERSKADAYAAARNDSISGGGAEASRDFQMNLTARTQGLSEMLRKRQLPLDELQRMQGLLTMPGFQQGQLPPWLQAAIASGNYGLAQTGQANQNDASGWSGAMQAVNAGANVAALSDEREKKNIRRYDEEAMPGVPLASFEYRKQPGKKLLGVIAQDVERVHPERVITRKGRKHVIGGRPVPFGF